ncbi:Serine protease snake [Papilio machaon]|uniref:Serine protease snake n=1 Tax=Papilio machaon TaxID=76193 RepID=A0A0N1PIR3_PAPMA|nr:Serine protease snake [Papilio machaon]
MPPSVMSTCEPIARNLTAERTGRKAWDKCLEYQNKLIYPCRESNTPSGGMIRLNLCNRKPDSLIIGGEDAYEGEFPHMVLLGYANGTSEKNWGCGGVLVSERFILTAGHCIYSKEFYAPNSRGMRHMKQGYNGTTQICFGDWHKKKDSCNGDSGGPVQIKHPQIYCMYSVIGITSWGRECGHPGQPAIYTRVAAYIPWIESIVWP